MAKYTTTASGYYYTTAGNQGTKFPIGMVFDGGNEKEIKGAVRRNKLNPDGTMTNLWVYPCVIYVEEPPTEPQDVIIRISESYDGGQTFQVSRYFREIQQ